MSNASSKKLSLKKVSLQIEAMESKVAPRQNSNCSSFIINGDCVSGGAIATVADV